MKVALLIELAGLVIAQAIYWYTQTQDWYKVFRDIWLPVGASLILWSVLFAVSDVWRSDVPAIFGGIVTITYLFGLYNGKFGTVISRFLGDINGSNSQAGATSTAGATAKNAGGR